MKGFDAEFRDLDHYIRTITDRIWEGRRLDDIRRYYAPDTVVETPASMTVGVDPVIEGTRATLAQFPDRRLLAEDVVVSGDETGGFLSSHRILSPMTHAGPGAFGAPCGRTVFVRTIADCVVRDNRIVHEWLVRDQSAIARQLGTDARSVAARWLAAREGFEPPAATVAPPPYRSTIDRGPLASAYARAWTRLWTDADPRALEATHTGHAIVALPGGETVTHADARARWWTEVTGALRPARFEVEHLTAVARPQRATTIAMRWRVRGVHAAAGRYGAPSGRDLSLMGICHADVEDGRVVREWVLIDEIALWMQVLAPRASRPRSADTTDDRGGEPQCNDEM